MKEGFGPLIYYTKESLRKLLNGKHWIFLMEGKDDSELRAKTHGDSFPGNKTEH